MTAYAARSSASRPVALVVGILYLLMAAWEAILGGLTVSGVPIFDAPAALNVLHWLVGLAALGSYFAREPVPRLTCRVIGSLLALVAILGFVARPVMGQVLGYTQWMPTTYLVLHFLTAVALLYAGFAAGRTARAARRRTTA